ncbi:MAG: hypothetical protein JO099_15440 [Acidobacteriia bacterium]|nr:hypothetical protein [Terriglobia bacterium]
MDVENGNGFAQDDRQIQLHGAVDLLLLSLRDIRTDRFGPAFHRFGGDIQAGKPFHLLSPIAVKCPERP